MEHLSKQILLEILLTEMQRKLYSQIKVLTNPEKENIIKVIDSCEHYLKSE